MAVFTAIDDAGLFFNTLLYSGTTSIQSVTGVGFTPDSVWFKSRDSAASHQLYDTVRGNASAVVSSTTAAAIDATGDGFTSLDADGYTFNAGGGGGNVNAANDFVAWNWKAGTTTGIDTTGSSITPSGYSFNATSGFSVIAYTGNGVSGALVPHGLGIAPQMIIFKRLDATGAWDTYHETMGNTKFLTMNTTASVNTSTGAWNDTSPTAVLFCLGNNAAVNTSSSTFVAYCFAGIQGYSKFGSYYGNGDNDGPFIYTEFSPARIMIKREDGTGNWVISDNKRLGYNGGNSYLSANDDAVENTGGQIDFVSNGVKIRNNGSYTNTSGGLYIYAAFAAQPLVNSAGVPDNAR